MSVTRFLPIFGITCIISISRATEILVDCYPNSTIIVSNPRPDTMHYALASDTDAACTVTFSSDYTLMTLAGCSKNDTIVIHLSETEPTSNYIGGTGSVLVSIICREIEQGVQRNITQSLGANLVMDDTSSVDLTFDVSCFIRNNSVTDPPMAIGRISDSVFFTYDLYDGYAMRFLQCTAYPGKDTTTFSVNHKLIENDCTVDSVRIDSFAPSKVVSVDKHTRYYTEIRLFRFWVSLYITIVCDVTICRDDSAAACTMATCDNTRRRRDMVEVNNEDVQHITTTSTFQVLDNPDYIIFEISSATSVVSGSTLLWMVAGMMLF